MEIPFNLIQILAVGTIKLSILFLYRRIFRGRGFGIFNWVLIGVVTAWTITFFIAYFAACGIAARLETIGDLKTECVNVFALVVAMTASDVAVDLVILILPVPFVRGCLRIWSRYAY